MTDERENRSPEFNGVNQREGTQEEARKEHEENSGEFSKADDMSLNDSIRNHAEVSGSTFGMESSTARFSNIGQKNQDRKGTADSRQDINNADHDQGSGGSGYSDFLNKAQNEFISGTGQFTEEARRKDGASSDSIRPFDAMQGNQEHGSGGRAEEYEAPSGDRRPNESST